MKQNHWTMKYRPEWHIYCEVNLVWYSLIISNYDVQLSNSLQIWSKVTGAWNIGHYDLHLLYSQNLCYWIIKQIVFKISGKVTGLWNHDPQLLRSKSPHYTKYDLQPWNNLQDMKQNYRIMKYRLLWPIFIIRLITALHWRIIPTRKTIFQTWSKIIGLWNTGHWDLH